MRPLARSVLSSLLLVAVAWSGAAGLDRAAARPGYPPLRGAWVWGTSCKDRDAADRILARAGMMNLNALYVLVFYWGATACYRSDAVPMNAAVAPGFDPLAYLIEKGRAQGLEIHAWFVNGSSARASWIFAQRPDWMAVNLLGQRVEWFDLCQESVREWQTERMLEVLRNYDLDGLHFDYIRFDGTAVCACPACRERAMADAGIDIEGLTYPVLPACGLFSGNPLDGPTTAKVLARFDDGVPAVAVNRLAAGEVVLFNWHAESNTPRAVHEAMRNALTRLGARPGGPVSVLDSDINAARYGHTPYELGRNWLASLGFRPVRITDTELLRLPAAVVVFLPWHYLMTDEQARSLAAFVRGGGGVLFLDGPVFALGTSASARELLGFARAGRYFNGERVLAADAADPGFVPSGGREITPEGERERRRAWDRWRKDQVTDLVRRVSREARRTKPGRAVTAAVFYNESGAEGVLQDWPAWVREGLLDYTIPMSYVDTPAQLEAAFAWWRTIEPGLERIIPAMSLYKVSKDLAPTERAARIGEFVDVCRRQGARGVVMFSMEHIDDGAARAVGEIVYPQPGAGEGDLDGDGDADFDDFFLFADTFGRSAGRPGYDRRADLNGDGTVDLEDFFRFAAAFGRGA